MPKLNVRNIFLMLWIAAAVAYIAWGWYSETGLYYFLVRKQLDILGNSYYPILTVLFMWLILGALPLKLLKMGMVNDTISEFDTLNELNERQKSEELKTSEDKEKSQNAE